MRQASTLCDATKRGHYAQCPLAEFLLHPADPRPCAASMVGILLAFDALRVCNRLRYLPAAGDCRAGPGLSQPLILLAARVESLVVTFIVTLFAMQRVLRKNFQRFRIGLASRTSPSSEPQYFEPTLGRALRVWWAYFWRMIFLLVVAFVVVGLPLNAFLGLFGQSLIFVQMFSVLDRKSVV